MIRLDSHHAYLLVGGQDEAESLVRKAFPNLGPDYFVFREELFGIDDARKLNDLAGRKAFGDKKVFLIAPEKITHEAQNALLKTFEEPTSDTHFFLVLREGVTVLPTLLSRMQVVSVQHSVLNKEAEKFLGSSIKGRLSFVKKFVDNEKNLSSFLDDLLLVLRRDNAPALKEVYKVRLVSDQRGTSPRLVLEHLALLL